MLRNSSIPTSSRRSSECVARAIFNERWIKLSRHARPCAGHPRLSWDATRTWMAGTSPAMTADREGGRLPAGIIEIERLSKVFDTAHRGRHLALKEISITVGEGQFVSIVGPSGCGKSTLLYVVGGFVAPTTGLVRVMGKPVSGPGPDRGPVFQEFALFPWK